MRTLVICAICFVVSAASNIPTGFVPLPPLPIANKPPSTKRPTPAPTTKKPIFTKPATIPTRPTPTTTASTLPSSTRPSSTLPSSVFVPTSQPQPSGSANCGLNVNVPGVQCNNAGSTNNAVQQALTILQQELDKTRQQHQAQNTAVQSMISQLQNRQSSYINKISDLQNEVGNLVKAFNTVCQGRRPSSTTALPFVPSVTSPTSTGVSNAALQKAVQDVKNDVRTAVQNFNNRVFNLSAIIVSSEQQDIKVSYTSRQYMCLVGSVCIFLKHIM